MFGILTTENDELVDFTFSYDEFCNMIDYLYRKGLDSGDLYYDVDVKQGAWHVKKHLKMHKTSTFRNVNTGNVVTFYQDTKANLEWIINIHGITNIYGRLSEDITMNHIRFTATDGEIVAVFGDLDEWELVQ